MESTVAEIHAYPERPREAGFMEPLFATPESRREVMEHFLLTPWLRRASELVRACGEEARAGTPSRGPSFGGRTAHRTEEPVKLRRESRGERTVVIRPGRCSRRGWRKRTVVGVIERWREVGGWWELEGERAVDRTVFRVELSGSSPSGRGPSTGAVVDLAFERRQRTDWGSPGGPRPSTERSSGGYPGGTWMLVGFVD